MACFPALDLGQQQLMMNQAPPPQALGQVNLGPQIQTSMAMTSLASLTNPMAPAPAFNHAQQHTMQLVSQPAPVPPGMGPPHMPGPVPAPSQPPPFQTLYTPLQVRSPHLFLCCKHNSECMC
jgi:hypothetical protein